MPSALVSDTHATIWYLLNDPRLSEIARREMEDAAQSGYAHSHSIHYSGGNRLSCDGSCA